MTGYPWDMARSDLNANHEQEQNQPRLAERIERAQPISWKEVPERVRRHAAQQRRTQQDSRDHFTHDAGLADAAQRGTQQMSGEEYRANLRKKQAEVRDRNRIA